MVLTLSQPVQSELANWHLKGEPKKGYFVIGGFRIRLTNHAVIEPVQFNIQTSTQADVMRYIDACWYASIQEVMSQVVGQVIVLPEKSGYSFTVKAPLFGAEFFDDDFHKALQIHNELEEQLQRVHDPRGIEWKCTFHIRQEQSKILKVHIPHPKEASGHDLAQLVYSFHCLEYMP
jgi:hypothetical protein